MAAAAVGGAFLSAFLQVLFDRMASREVLDFFKSRKSSHQLLQKLKIKMISVNSLLDDAEVKQFTDPHVRKWLDELKDAVYEADDLLDEIAYETLRSEMEVGPQTVKHQLLSFFGSLDPFSKEMELKLLEILERLEDLLKESDVLGFQKGVRDKPSSGKILKTSLPDEADGFYGREKDKKVIVELLISDDPNGNNPSVIPVVGMAGVGKTTLAQHVYHDRTVVEWFDIRAWVSVSDEFNVSKVTKDILEEVTHKDSAAETLNQLQLKLQDGLKGKRFLLVLDDVWSDNYAEWCNLLLPLKFGSKGSKIIVTTRHESVASVICTVKTHRLEKLTDNDCWILFSRHVFYDRDPSRNQDLEGLGKEIVRKCNGLPLAAKALAGVLRCERDGEKWKKVLKSNLWDLLGADVLPALRLSYYHLPSHLKRCFAYCAMFPKDYQFEIDELVLLWMAEGFLVQPNGNKEIEEVGEEYFSDLVSRSFFQRYPYGEQPRFVMHDLMNDLAKFVSGEFCARLEDNNSCNVPKRARHVSYERTSDPFAKFQCLRETQLLRSFVLAQQGYFHCSGGSQRTCVDGRVIEDLLPMLKHLRVLSVSCYEIVELPRSIGNLKHFQYLNFSETSITQLPESVCALYNLQTLILYGCRKLVRLPANLQRLINLCHLDLRGTGLREMPSQMSNLKKLRKLTHFILGKHNGPSIKELGMLKHLRGEMCIRNLQNVTDAKEASESYLKGKKKLKALKLEWQGDTDNSAHERDVLDRLHPTTDVERLAIQGYGGTRFPDWVGDISFSKISSLKLSNCKYCTSLPPLGHLVSLTELYISSFHSVLTVGDTFYGRYKLKSFASLKILEFKDLANWTKWSCNRGREGGAFPLLEKLHISGCPYLTSIPHRLPSLEELHIGMGKFLECGPPGPYPSVFPNLKSLYIEECSDFDVLIAPGKITQGVFTSITYLRIFNCSNLKWLPECMKSLLPSLERLTISNCPGIESFPLEGLPSRLEHLEIIDCKKLIGHRMNWDLQSLPSLSFINIIGRGCADVESSFPEETLLPSTLTYLMIQNFENLKCLNYKGLQHLTSLKHLYIYSCPQLESLPDDGLPSSLSHLTINNCPLLAQRCEREKGEDWPKIKSIPSIHIII